MAGPTTSGRLQRPTGGTMTVVMKVRVTGTRNGATWPAVGETIELPTEEALGYIDAGICEPRG